MTTLRAFIKQHPVLSYFVLAFAISWGGVLLVIGGPGGIPGTTEQIERLFPLAILAMFAGPSVAGILLTGLVYGKAGLREFQSRLLLWRVGARWYATALLTAPLLITVVLLALSLISPVFLTGIFASEDKVNLLLFGIAAGLGVGIFEELGWTGFAIPRLRRQYGVLTTGLIVGFLWGAWHFLVGFWGSGNSSGAFSLPLFLPQFFSYVGVLPVFRVLMVWVYDRTESLLLAMLMHASFTASIGILMPLATGVLGVTYDLVLAVAMWVVVAAVAKINRRQLWRQPLRRQMN